MRFIVFFDYISTEVKNQKNVVLNLSSTISTLYQNLIYVIFV